MKNLFAATLCALVLVHGANAQAPRVIPFQWRLTDGSGKPIPDGARLIQFQIYGEPAGGSPLWAGEVHRTTVNGGLVSVILGSKNPLPAHRPDNPSRSFFDASLYLQVTVDADTNGVINQADPPLLPRQSVLPVVFASESSDSRKLAGYDWSSLFGVNNPLGKIPSSKLSIDGLSLSNFAARRIVQPRAGQEGWGDVFPLGSIVQSHPMVHQFAWLDGDGGPGRYSGLSQALGGNNFETAGDYPSGTFVNFNRPASVWTKGSPVVGPTFGLVTSGRPVLIKFSSLDSKGSSEGDSRGIVASPTCDGQCGYKGMFISIYRNGITEVAKWSAERDGGTGEALRISNDLTSVDPNPPPGTNVYSLHVWFIKSYTYGSFPEPSPGKPVNLMPGWFLTLQELF